MHVFRPFVDGGVYGEAVEITCSVCRPRPRDYDADGRPVDRRLLEASIAEHSATMRLAEMARRALLTGMFAVFVVVGILSLFADRSPEQRNVSGRLLIANGGLGLRAHADDVEWRDAAP